MNKGNRTKENDNLSFKIEWILSDSVALVQRFLGTCRSKPCSGRPSFQDKIQLYWFHV